MVQKQREYLQSSKQLLTFAQQKTFSKFEIMKRKVFILLLNLLFCLSFTMAQEPAKSQLHQRAEAESQKGNVTGARSLFIRAYEDYANKGMMQQGVECGVKASTLYHKENLYKEAFDLLRVIDQNIIDDTKDSFSDREGMHYLTSKERMQMYIKMHRADRALEHLNNMDKHANASSNENLKPSGGFRV